MLKIPYFGTRKQLTDFYSKILPTGPNRQAIYKIFQVPEKQFNKR